MTTQTMIRTHPGRVAVDQNLLADCINACFECFQACTACADACLSEEHVDMLRRCIRLNLDCADLCDSTARMLSRQTEPAWGLMRSAVQTMSMACQVCGQECERHAGQHEHCRVCAEACRKCEEACNRLLNAMPA